MNRNEIIQSIQENAPFYTPEWRLDTLRPDAGSAFALTFAEMFSETYAKYDRLMEKHRIELINALGVEQADGTAASGTVCFSLAHGAPEGTHVDKDTPLYSENGTVYTTTQPVFVSPAGLQSVYCRMGDRFYRAGKGVDSFKLFEQEENLQRHDLYIGHDWMFSSGETIEICLLFQGENLSLFGDETVTRWEYFTGQWSPVSAAEYRDERLFLTCGTGFAPFEVGGRESYFLRCRALRPAAGEITIKSLVLSVKNAAPPAARLYQEDIECVEEPFEPFGKSLSPFSCCYIACSGAFCQKGAKAELSFTLLSRRQEIANPIPEIPVEWKNVVRQRDLAQPPVYEAGILRLSAEYWNGRDFVTLPLQQNPKSLFAASEQPVRKTLSFLCPEDMTAAVMYGQESMWLRFRLLEVSNPYRPNTQHITPELRGLKIRYEYETPLPPHAVCAENNRQWVNALPQKPFEFLPEGESTLYFGFDRPLGQEPLGFLWETDPYKEQYETGWRIFSNGEWKPLYVSGCLWQTGVTMLDLTEPMEPCRIFGEDGYWLRADVRSVPAKPLIVRKLWPGAAPVCQKLEPDTDICTGNCEKGNITKLGYSVGYICGVTNPLPLTGGRNRETPEMLLKRGGGGLISGGRAVTASSYEALAREAMGDLLKCKCVPGMNEKGTPEPGAVTLVYWPETPADGIRQSETLRDALLEQAPPQARIYVRQAVAVELSITARIAVRSRKVIAAREELERELARFLHPEKGNFQQNGFQIGELPEERDMISFLHSFGMVCAIEYFHMAAVCEGDELDLSRYPLSLFALPSGGRHSIKIRSVGE